MKNFIVTIWKDAVWSNVIATAIVAATGFIFSSFASPLSSAKNFVTHPITLSLLAILALLMLGILSLRIYQWIKQKHIKQLAITNRDDIISILSSWWPEQKGFPRNVHVDFSMLDKKYNLHPGSTAAVIEDVAKLNGFLKESGGDSHATFTYDMPPIITIHGHHVYTS